MGFKRSTLTSGCVQGRRTPSRRAARQVWRLRAFGSRCRRRRRRSRLPAPSGMDRLPHPTIQQLDPLELIEGRLAAVKRLQQLLEGVLRSQRSTKVGKSLPLALFCFIIRIQPLQAPLKKSLHTDRLQDEVTSPQQLPSGPSLHEIKTTRWGAPQPTVSTKSSSRAASATVSLRMSSLFSAIIAAHAAGIAGGSRPPHTST